MKYKKLNLLFLFLVFIMVPAHSAENILEKATFAGGCFWCMEHVLEELNGVENVVSGYIGGHNDAPNYKIVSSGTTGHVEAIQVTYDPTKTTYSKLLDVFWKQIDPTDKEGQFVDRGAQYTTAIFYHSEEQKKLAEKSRDELDKSGIYDKPIITAIRPATMFYLAENYHQDYKQKNPIRYKLYRFYSGRDQYLDKVWGDESGKDKGKKEGAKYMKPSKDEIKKKLTPLQYKVTQEDGTERAFDNEYWDNKEEGIYVDIVTGEPLFSSHDKFKSGTGWPSFTKPIKVENVQEKEDDSFFTKRTEVRSKYGDSHLGHVFSDGPEPTGLRYCINSASLLFVAKKDMGEKGYGEYLKLFEK